MENVQAFYILIHVYILMMIIRNHGEIKYCPGTGNVGCWVSTATESSNQSPSIDFQTSPVNSPDQNKPIDLGASSSYSNSDDNPLARLISSLDQPIPSVGVDTTTPNYASPPIEKFEVPTGDEEGLQFPEAASKFPNLFVDPILWHGMVTIYEEVGRCVRGRWMNN